MKNDIEYNIGDDVLCKKDYEYGFLSHNDIIYDTVFEKHKYYKITEITKYSVYLEAWKPFDIDVEKFYDYFYTIKEIRSKKLEKIEDNDK